MRLIGLVVGFSLTLLPPAADAQEHKPGKVYRVGWLAPARVPSNLADFRDQLRALGWTEGENVSIKECYYGGANEALASLAAELVAAKVDLIVALTTSATIEVHKRTTSIPVVFVVGGDPVARGLAVSFGRPGKNLTGIASQANLELSVKMLEVLRNTVPQLARVGVFHVPTVGHVEAMQAVADGARTLSVQAVPIAVTRGAEIDQAQAVVSRERVQALLVLASPFFYSEKDRFVRPAARMRLPAMYENRGLQKRAGSCRTGSTCGRYFGVWRRRQTKSSRAPSPPTCRSSSRRNSNWSST
jgi:putative tryptophan/tyrosine transport system substrate-binding protein